MKNIKNILLPLSLVAIFSMTSCNSGLVRVNYNNVINHEEAKERLKTIRKNQLTDDEKFTLFNDGTVSYKYSISITGDVRLDKGYTLDNLNLTTSGYVNFAWDISNNYFKTDGPKEIKYVIRDGGDWWEAKDYQRGIERAKKKQKVNDIVRDDFVNYIVAYEGTYDLSTGIFFDNLFLMDLSIIYSSGLTGFADADAEYVEGVLTPHKIFTSTEYEDFFKAIHDEYDSNHKDGHYIEEKYMADDNGSLACGVKGDIDLTIYNKIWKDVFWYLSGTATFDTFTAWEDNFIRQSILHLNAHVVESQQNEWNLTFKVDVEEDVKKGCDIDKVNLSDYN